MGDALDGSRTSTDDRDLLIVQAGQVSAVVSTGVFVVPATGMKCVSFEGGNA